jgi:hypothetical protein
MSHSGLKRRLERALGKLEGPRHRRSKNEYEAVYDDAPVCLGYGLAQRALPFSFGCRSLRWRRRRSLRIRSQSLAILGPRTRCRLNQRASTSIRHRIPPTAAGAPGGTSRSLARACISRCLFRTNAPAEVLASRPRDWDPRRARLWSFPVVLAPDETRAIVFDGRRRRGSSACGLRYPSCCLLDVCIVLNSSLLTGKPVDACIDRRVEVMR